MRHANLNLNDKWTATEPLLSWRHFRIVMRRYQDDVLMIELMAACDREARVWVSAVQLKDKTQFTPGWTRSGELAPT